MGRALRAHRSAHVPIRVRRPGSTRPTVFVSNPSEDADLSIRHEHEAEDRVVDDKIGRVVVGLRLVRLHGPWLTVQLAIEGSMIGLPAKSKSVT